ncbi:MAG: hypothetical protein JO112_18400 [Planctomycetes bacterium]|nr:hypothetical protein [Planctomycetota bacterium]
MDKNSHPYPVLPSSLFAEVPSSLTPAAVKQWFTYRFTIAVQNQAGRPLRLSTATLLRMGAGLAHVCESGLHQETVVQPGETAALEFGRVRVCGYLPADNYNPVLVLNGFDGQQAFSEELITTGNPCSVIEQPVDTQGGGEATAPVYDFVATSNGALLRYRITPANRYPTDVQLSLVHPGQFFEPFLEDGSPAEGHVFTDLLGPTETPLLIKPKGGLEPGKRYSEGRFLTWNVFQVQCPHQGASLAIPLSLDLLGSIDTDPRLLMTAIDLTPKAVHPGEKFEVDVTVANGKGYGIFVDLGTGATRMRAAKDGADASHLFVTEQVVGPYVEAGFSSTLPYQVRVREDVAVAPGVYTLYPVVRSTRPGFDGATPVEFAALVDGKQATPVISIPITVLGPATR